MGIDLKSCCSSMRVSLEDRLVWVEPVPDAQPPGRVVLLCQEAIGDREVISFCPWCGTQLEVVSVPDN